MLRNTRWRNTHWGVWAVVAGIVGALLPGIFLSIDPHPHFPWLLAWMIIGPFTGIIAAALFVGGRYVVRRGQR